MPGLSALAALEGDWSLTRRITHGGGQVDGFTGTCRFTRSGRRLLQDETGWLQTETGRFQATRRYIWAEKNGWLEVYFDDMRPFHSIPLNAEQPETVHLCDPDRYHVAYDFGAWPLWRAVWTVEGPRKDYTMETTFQRPRLASADAAVHKAGNI